MANGVCKELVEAEEKFDGAYNKFQKLIAEKKDQQEFRDHMNACIQLKKSFLEVQSVGRSMIHSMAPKVKSKAKAKADPKAEPKLLAKAKPAP